MHVMFIYNGMMAFIHKFFGRISLFSEENRKRNPFNPLPDGTGILSPQLQREKGEHGIPTTGISYFRILNPHMTLMVFCVFRHAPPDEERLTMR